MSRKKLIITAIVLTLVLAIGGILAYFTDAETRTNRFKTAKVDIFVDEPSWPDDPNEEVPVTPNQEVDKDPIIENRGDGAVYAFAEVTVPVANVKVGTATEPAPTELFSFIKSNGDAGINDGWTQIARTPQIDPQTNQGTVTYVFAYGSEIALTELAKDQQTTNPVFSKVKFADVKEQQYSEDTPSSATVQGKLFDVVVNGYGIQKEGLTSNVPATVWPLVK